VAGNRTRAAPAVLIAVLTASGAVTGAILGMSARWLSTSDSPTWVVGRAAGLTSYVLLVGLVSMGLVLSHPWRVRLRRPNPASQLRAHLTLAAFTGAFTVLHVVAMATDPYAGVGWRGLVAPMGVSYRPVPVTMGVIGLYAGLLAGLTAALSGRLPLRVWWPIHKAAAVCLLLIWLHAVLTGSDTAVMRGLYLGTGAAVGLLALSRYLAVRVTEVARPRKVGQ
jgi:hypothetical protein